MINYKELYMFLFKILMGAIAYYIFKWTIDKAVNKELIRLIGKEAYEELENE